MRSASAGRSAKVESGSRRRLRLRGRSRSKARAATRFPPAFDSSTTCLSCSPSTGGFDLKLQAKGDLDVDQHHSTQWRMSASCLGQPYFEGATGDRKGINRAGYFCDDHGRDARRGGAGSGRPAGTVVYDDKVKVRLVGDLQTELVEDFFGGFCQSCGARICNAEVRNGRSNHHNLEAIDKCFARALRYACSKDARLRRNSFLPPSGLL